MLTTVGAMAAEVRLLSAAAPGWRAFAAWCAAMSTWMMVRLPLVASALLLPHQFVSRVVQRSQHALGLVSHWSCTGLEPSPGLERRLGRSGRHIWIPKIPCEPTNGDPGQHLAPILY
jgi:hypothetical protein